MSSEPVCVIDKNILNEETLPDLSDMGLSCFASACGKNRGAFVLDPPDGNTYGCLSLPKNMPELAGVDDLEERVHFKDANSIKQNYENGKTDEEQTLAMLDFYVQNVYQSTPNKVTSPYACDVSGLAELQCKASSKSIKHLNNGEPIRSVTLSGVFVDALWATKGKSLSLAQVQEWYTQDDFDQMQAMGLNTVQIPIPASTFAGNDMGGEIQTVLQKFLNQADQANLKVLLTLEGSAGDDAMAQAAIFAASQDMILGLTLPTGMVTNPHEVVAALRVVAPDLALFLPLSFGDLIMMKGEYGDNVYGALDYAHSSTIADIASSTPIEDRSKMFYHESMSCMARSPLEFSTCLRGMPVLVSNGFDLSIDNCALQELEGSDFEDFGQCSHFQDTIDSPWWDRHRKSYAARQLFAYEQGLGWSFATWKLYHSKEEGILDQPAKLLSLSDVHAAGLLPALDGPADGAACLNTPLNDFMMGDNTLAPTASPPPPPPDCGNGWWNYDLNDCEYWIPPTPCPTCVECPTLPPVKESNPVHLAIGGAIAGAIVAAILMKFACSNKRGDYEPINN